MRGGQFGGLATRSPRVHSSRCCRRRLWRRWRRRRRLSPLPAAASAAVVSRCPPRRRRRSLAIAATPWSVFLLFLVRWVHLGASRLYVDSTGFRLNPREKRGKSPGDFFDFSLFFQGFSSPDFAEISAAVLRIFLVRSRAPETKI